VAKPEADAGQQKRVLTPPNGTGEKLRGTNPGVLFSSYVNTPSYISKKADLFLITLADGVTTYKWTDYDTDITYIFDTYVAQGPLLKRTRLTVNNTCEVPELTLSLAALDTDFVGGLNVKQQIHNGFFDGATVQLSRAVILYGINNNLLTVNMIGAYPGGMFSGKIGPIKVTAMGAELTVKGGNVVFNQYAPRNTYQLPCMHTFCDAGCTLSATTYTATNTVGASPTTLLIPWGTVPGSPGVYTYGRVIMTSGAALGQRRSVKFSSAAGLMLQYPLYNVPAPGDTFSVLEGCDKQFNSGSGQDCTARSNTQHYRGFPYVPPSETAF
jgi:uncharacterized phage protein (TIGR02218 family)